jgi:acyl-CoA synthetase (AMP-forming)/AMP-acid ligase II
LFPADAALVARALPGAEFTVVYGSTEAEPISHLDARTLAAADWTRGLPVGQPHERIAVRIVTQTDGPIAGSDLDRLTLPDGGVGEICVAGSHVLETYFENSDAQHRNKIFASQTFHRTGDAGYLSDGELFLMGRVRQIFSDARGTHYPFLVEGRLREIDGIAIGTCVDVAGQGVLVVETVPGASPEAVSAALAQGPFDGLPVKFIPKIPRDPRHHSKIDYDALLAVLR